MKTFLMIPLALLLLAGCQREGPSDENSVNIVADNAYENVMPDETALPVQDVVNVTNMVDAAPPPPAVDEQEQTQEDADATGMTARTDREAAADQGDDSAPVERK